MIYMQKKNNYNNRTFYSNKNHFPFDRMKQINELTPVFNTKKNEKKKEKLPLAFKPKTEVTLKEFKERPSLQTMKDKIKVYMKSVNKSKSKSKDKKVRIMDQQISPRSREAELDE